MSQNDKAMELIKALRSAGGDGDAIYCWNMCMKAADHIEATQKDCRTCVHFWAGEIDPICHLAQPCVNHDKYQPMLEFKHLTGKE